jgi:hypothetical protein
MCGGFLPIFWRSEAGVSPVRTAVRMGAKATPRAASSAISGQRHFQVLVNVVAERLQRRDVNDFGLIRERAGAGGAHQFVEADQKRGQRLARSGGRGDQHVVPGANFRPAQEG